MSAARLATQALRCGSASHASGPALLPGRAQVGARADFRSRRSLASSASTRSGGAGAGAGAASAPDTRMRSSTRGARPELPTLPNRRPLFLALAVVGVAGWAGFAQFATNKERLSSSAFRSALVQIKDSPAAQAALGDPIMLVPSLVGDPWISGSVNTMQGRVDLSFEVKGPKSKGRAYFTSIRPAMHMPFEIIRFLIVTDQGDSISLLPD
ncbi:cytochrome oxidase assembly protein 1 [Tilletia horrida]|nr:cytochrome oxidase assembly protein 1 [Tilletia horrida]